MEAQARHRVSSKNFDAFAAMDYVRRSRRYRFVKDAQVIADKRTEGTKR